MQLFNFKKQSFISINLNVWLAILIMCQISCNNKSKEKHEKLAEKRPNVILILADDMGYSDLGCYGSEIKTPALDELAQNGLRMTQFYNASRCCPSRASLLTGLYPHQANMGFMQEDCKLPGYGGHLPDNAITIAQLLKQNGYNTAMSGKWHVGNDEGYWPTKKGFDKFYGFPHHGGAYFYPFAGDQIIVNGETPFTPEKGFYSTDAINANAEKFVEEMSEDEKPFFLYLAHVAPHFPLQAKPEDIAKYRGKYKRAFEDLREERFAKMKAEGILPGSYKLSPIDGKSPNWDTLSDAEKDDFDLRMSIYAAQIDCMDQGIGRLVEKLKALNQYDNTVIMFLSDNGGTREDYTNPDLTAPLGEPNSFGCYKLPWANVSNTPFRMFKHWGHEGGIRTPFIVHYPNMIKKARIDNQPAHIMDIMSTVADLAKAEYPKTYNGHDITPTEGLSLVPVFKNEVRQPHKDLFWEHEGNKAARIGQWKWVNAYPEEMDELFDLSQDPTELNNLAKNNPEKLNTMKAQWQQWADRVGVVPWEKVLEAEPSQGRLQIYY
uniref:arylsulfatase n=2 Tax=Mariniflexile sp. TaxID=1979402 RepID=UPI0040475CE6